MIVNNQMFAA